MHHGFGVAFGVMSTFALVAWGLWHHYRFWWCHWFIFSVKIKYQRWYHRAESIFVTSLSNMTKLNVAWFTSTRRYKNLYFHWTDLLPFCYINFFTKTLLAEKLKVIAWIAPLLWWCLRLSVTVCLGSMVSMITLSIWLCNWCCFLCKNQIPKVISYRRQILCNQFV